MKVTVSEYDKEWPKLFEQEQSSLLKALGKTAAIIVHVGSTSVPDLASRPIIDIMIGLRDFASADNLIPKVMNLGYTYINEYEEVIPDRRFFRKIQDGKDAYHIHMVGIDGKFWERHLLFRDYLRKNQKTAEEYAFLKKELSNHQWKNADEYVDAKTQFIKAVENKVQVRKKHR